MTGFLTLTHILKALRTEREKMIKDGSLKESGRSKFPVNRNSIVKLENAGIVNKPEQTMVYATREDRLYTEEELVKIVDQVKKYVESRT